MFSNRGPSGLFFLLFEGLKILFFAWLANAMVLGFLTFLEDASEFYFVKAVEEVYFAFASCSKVLAALKKIGSGSGPYPLGDKINVCVLNIFVNALQSRFHNFGLNLVKLSRPERCGGNFKIVASPPYIRGNRRWSRQPRTEQKPSKLKIKYCV